MQLENRIGYIYKVTSPNSKVYVGQTINLRQRKSAYKTNHFKNQLKLWNSCEKHNWNPIDTFEVIEECLCGAKKCYLNEREIYWIKELDAFGPNGLNCNEGGGCNTGYIASEETKKKISLAGLGRKHSAESKKLMSESNKGKIRSKETKELLSKINKGKSLSKETKRKMSEASKGKPKSKKSINKTIETKRLNNNIYHTEETKQKLRLLMTDEKKEKIKESKLKNPYKHSEERKKKISEMGKGRKQSQETINKRIETQRLNKILKNERSNK